MELQPERTDTARPPTTQPACAGATGGRLAGVCSTQASFSLSLPTEVGLKLWRHAGVGGYSTDPTQLFSGPSEILKQR